MKNKLAYGFLDESPSLSDNALFFCVSIITTEEKTNKRLHNIMKRARKRIVKKKLKSLAEIKFNNSEENTKTYILSQIAKEKVDIVAIAVDKEGRRIKDTPENYGMVVGAAIAETLALHPLLNLSVDKKFTSPIQEQEFLTESQKVAQSLVKGNTNLSFNPPLDSVKESNIQLADFIAGAINFKYNNKDSHYLDLIKEKIKVEKVFKWTWLKKRIVNP